MMEDESRYSKNITKSTDSIASDFLKIMQDKDKLYDLPDSEIKIKFLIQVFLVENNIVRKKNLQSSVVEGLVSDIFNIVMQHKSDKDKGVKLSFSKAQTEAMIRGARSQQLGEKSHAKLTEEEEKDIYGQTIREFDESQN